MSCYWNFIDVLTKGKNSDVIWFNQKLFTIVSFFDDNIRLAEGELDGYRRDNEDMLGDEVVNINIPSPLLVKEGRLRIKGEAFVASKKIEKFQMSSTQTTNNCEQNNSGIESRLASGTCPDERRFFRQQA